MRTAGRVLAAMLLGAGALAAASAQTGAVGDEQRQQEFGPEEQVALYTEAAHTHDGSAYTLDVARFADCAAAQKLLADLQAPRNRLRALRQVTRVLRDDDRALYTMEPQLRAQVRSLPVHGRTEAVRLPRGGCVVAEVVEMRAQPLPEFEQLRPLLFELVERGMLPRPEALAGDPALQQRTLANGVNSSEAVDLLPASFPIDTRRSDGHTILTRALAQGRADIVRRALARGANPNLCAPRACPLELALGVRDDARAWDLLELLLRAGADANQLDPAQHALTLPLAAAAARGLRFTQRLVIAGANVQGVAAAAPPLFLAAAAGRQEVVDWLIGQGADPLARDTSRPGAFNTAFVAAQQSHSPPFVEWMEKRMLEAAAQSGRYRCDVWVEQDGARVQGEAGAFSLRRAPFRIVVRMPENAEALLVASAQTPAFQDDVRARARESAIFRPGTVGAEYNDGTSDFLQVLSPAVPTTTGVTQSWHWNGDKDRRFSGRRQQGAATEYYKDIRTIALALAGDRTEEIALSRYQGGDIYIVAAVPVYLSLSDHRFVEPRFLRLRFE